MGGRATSLWSTASLRRKDESTPIATLFAEHLLGPRDVRSGELRIAHLAPGPYLIDVTDSGCASVFSWATR